MQLFYSVFEADIILIDVILQTYMHHVLKVVVRLVTVIGIAISFILWCISG